MALEVGKALGLSQSMNYDSRISDLRYQQNELRRAKAENEAKAQMFASDMDFQNAANSFDNPRIKEYGKQQIAKIGAFMRENPDYQSDVTKLAALNLMKRELKDNPELIRGVASDNAFKQMNADLAEVAKNPNMHNTDAYAQLEQQRQNYLRFGNQDGEEAARKEGAKAFVYNKPRDFTDLGKVGLERGNRFKGAAMDIQYLKNGRDGAYQTVPKKQLLDQAAQELYMEHKDQFDYQYTKNGKDPIAAARQLIEAGIETKFDIGDKNTLGEQMALARYKASLENVPAGKSPYEITVLKPGYTVANPNLLDGTFGRKIPHSLNNNDGSIKIDNTGDVFNYSGHIYDKGYRDDGKYQKTGEKIVDGYVYKSLDWAKENGIVNEPFGPDLGRTPKVDGDWSKKAEIVETPLDKDGKSEKIVKIKVNANINANDPSYQGRYDGDVVTAKQRVAPQDSYLQKQVLKDEKGNLFVMENGVPVPYTK
jgi:hypothetical protein